MRERWLNLYSVLFDFLDTWCELNFDYRAFGIIVYWFPLVKVAVRLSSFDFADWRYHTLIDWPSPWKKTWRSLSQRWNYDARCLCKIPLLPRYCPDTTFLYTIQKDFYNAPAVGTKYLDWILNIMLHLAMLWSFRNAKDSVLLGWIRLQRHIVRSYFVRHPYRVSTSFQPTNWQFRFVDYFCRPRNVKDCNRFVETLGCWTKN